MLTEQYNGHGLKLLMFSVLMFSKHYISLHLDNSLFLKYRLYFSYNVDNISAEMAMLETKYQQRYVSNETQSLMNTGHTPKTKKERGLTTQVKPLEQNVRLMRRKSILKPQILAEAKAKLALVENKRRILVPGYVQNKL